jgi:hypothetical protein
MEQEEERAWAAEQVKGGEGAGMREAKLYG